jgi:hypothetical protein
MKNITIFGIIVVLVLGTVYLALPFLKLNSKPKYWENGYEQPVSPRLKNTLNGRGKGV